MMSNRALDEIMIQFRFIPVKGEGHFGYIENVETGRIVHPACGTEPPSNGTLLNFHSARHSGALFTYDALNDAIRHISGKYMHDGGTYLQLRDGLRSSSHFQCVNAHDKEIDPCPTPELTGGWQMVNCILDPAANHTYTYSYTTGMSKTLSSTSQHEWSVSAEGSFLWFSASAEYSGLAENTNEDTWSEERTVERSITVTPGKSVVTWQWVFGAAQFGNSLQFKSSFLADTDSLKKPPKLEGLEEQPKLEETEVFICNACVMQVFTIIPYVCVGFFTTRRNNALC